jgi:hypothetical protein
MSGIFSNPAPVWSHECWIVVLNVLAFRTADHSSMLHFTHKYILSIKCLLSLSNKHCYGVVFTG